MVNKRWIVPWADSEDKAAICHCVARIVDKRFAFGVEDKEQFRMYMRMMENFSSCRVLAYCVMCNRFHILLEEGEEKLKGVINAEGGYDTEVVKKGMRREKVATELARLEAGRDVALRQILRWRVRYFTDGAVIGSRAFVERLFRGGRDRFGAKRHSGARKLRGRASQAAGLVWAARDLRKDIG